MGKDFGGSDFLYIGLGLGAIYAIYKLTKPVEDAANAASGAVQAAGNAVGGAINAGTNAVNQATGGLNQALSNPAQTFGNVASDVFQPGGIPGQLLGAPSWGDILSSVNKTVSGLFSSPTPTPTSYPQSNPYASVVGRPNVDYTPVPPFVARAGIDYTPVSSGVIDTRKSSMYTSSAPVASYTPVPSSVTGISSIAAPKTTTLFKGPIKTGSSGGVIGAAAGTVFAGGAYVKSTGASGKYKTTL